MRFSRNRHVVATIIAAACVAVPATASASADIWPQTTKSDAAQSGSAGSLLSTDRSDAAQSGSAGSLLSTDRSDAAQSGSAGSSLSTDRSDAAQSGSDVPGRVDAMTAFPSADFRGGDTPADFPGTAGSPTAATTTIEVVRPERTIVRDVDEALPLILSGAALLLVLAGLAVTFVHARMLPRAGRSH
jgi:hypothetical protein